MSRFPCPKPSTHCAFGVLHVSCSASAIRFTIGIQNFEETVCQSSRKFFLIEMESLESACSALCRDPETYKILAQAGWASG